MTGAQLTIITHNAYWFQGWPPLWGAEEPHAHSVVVTALGDLYARCSPDVLCLQEVPDRRVVAELESRLGMRGTYVPGAMRSEYGGAVLVRGMAASFRVLSEGSGSIGAFERFCVHARICADGRGFDLLALHLSSNRYAPDSDGEPLRLAELDMAFGECPGPDLVLGDFNARPDSQVYRHMQDLGYRDSGEGMTAYITGQEPKRRRVDYIWIAESGALDLVEHRVISGAEFTLGGVELSDHLPVCVGVRVRV